MPDADCHDSFLKIQAMLSFSRPYGRANATVYVCRLSSLLWLKTVRPRAKVTTGSL